MASSCEGAAHEPTYARCRGTVTNHSGDPYGAFTVCDTCGRYVAGHPAADDDHPEATEQVLDAFYRNLYGPGFAYSVDRAFVSRCKTPCLVLAGNDEAHPFAISEEMAKLLPSAELITEWKEGAALVSARARIKQFLAEHTPARA